MKNNELNLKKTIEELEKELKRAKGTSRAIRELFDDFGYATQTLLIELKNSLTMITSQTNDQNLISLLGSVQSQITQFEASSLADLELGA